MSNHDLFLPLCDPEIERLHEATAHYTRDPVVDQVLDMAGWPETRGKLLDPGAGDGVFLERALARLDVAPNDTAAVTARLVGWEVHPLAAEAARTRITRHLLARGWSESAATVTADQVVINRDFLDPGPTRREYSVVAGNPPYLRWSRLPKTLRHIYSETVPRHAQADILHAFLERCADVLRDDGVLCAITADRVWMNQASAHLRDQIGQRFGIARLERLDPGTTYYRAKTRKAGTPPRVHPVAVCLCPAAVATQALTRDPVYPGTPPPIPAGAVPLTDVATIRLAPWLGPHGVFTLDIADLGPKGIPPDACIPCVDARDLDADDRLATPSRVALRTGKTDTHPAVLAHLRENVHLIPPSKRKPPFWRPPEPIGKLPWKQDAILLPRIARKLRPIRLPAGILPINHNLTVAAPRIPIETLMRALSSDFVQAWIAHHAPPLEHGYLSITPSILRELPVVLTA